MRPGSRVAWSDAFLATGQRIDPAWARRNAGARGTLMRIQRDGDLVVQWDDCDCETVHPPHRITAIPHVMTRTEAHWRR